MIDLNVARIEFDSVTYVIFEMYCIRKNDLFANVDYADYVATLDFPAFRWIFAGFFLYLAGFRYVPPSRISCSWILHVPPGFRWISLDLPRLLPTPFFFPPLFTSTKLYLSWFASPPVSHQTGVFLSVRDCAAADRDMYPIHYNLAFPAEFSIYWSSDRKSVV